jgi:hypothetical protein
MSQPTLGRLVPPDFEHTRRYGYASILAGTTRQPVERTLPLLRYRGKYVQGTTNACVGFSLSWMMSILNRRYYDAPWLWQRAKQVGGWPGNDGPNDNNGTYLRAGLDVLREEGHRRHFRGETRDVDMNEGIKANRWAADVDEIRTAIGAGTPVVLGIGWYSSFFTPTEYAGRHWIGRGAAGTWGSLPSLGHAICAYGASDRYQALKLVNTWDDWPTVYMPYDTVAHLLNEAGEAAVVTDR